MRNLRILKVWRDVRLHGTRTALVVLAIAIGIDGAGSVLDTWALLRRVTVEGFLGTNPPSATLRMDAVTAPVLAAVRALPEVKAAESRRTVMGTVTADGTARTAMLFVSADIASHTIGRVAGDSGTWPPPDRAFVIEHSSSDFANVHPGGTVSLRVGEGAPLTLPVTGMARDGTLAPGWMEHVVYGFVSPATIAALGGDSTPNDLRIVVREGADDRDAIRRIAARVRTKAEGAGARVRDVVVPVPGRHEHQAQMDSLLFTQGAFGLLLLLLSGFLVVNLVTGMLAGQQREIGIMKTLGASPEQLTVMYLGLALGLGLIACVVAIPLAAVIGRGYAQFSASMLNFEIGDTPIPRWTFAVQLAAGALLPVLAALVPVRRGCAVSVSESLRDSGLGSAPATAAGRLFGASGLARPLLLSLRNAFRKRERMVLTLLTLATSGAVFLGALNLRASIRDSVSALYEDELRFQLSVRFEQRHAGDSLVALASAEPGVERTEAWSGARAAVVGDDSLPRSAFVVTALPADTKLVAYPASAGRWLSEADSDGIVVTPRLLEEEPALTLGARVPLLIAGKARTWTVVGIVGAGPAAGAYVTRTALAHAIGDSTVGTVALRLTPMSAAAQADFIQRIRARYEAAGLLVASTNLVQAGRGALEDHLLMVASFLGLMSQLMIIVGGLGLASTMSLGVLERTREIGVLRAIGARHGAILTMIQVEGLVVTLLGWALAIPLSLPMSVILERAFARIMFEVPVTLVPNAFGVVAWLGVVLVVSFLACLWPAVRAMRITTAAALAYE